MLTGAAISGIRQKLANNYVLHKHSKCTKYMQCTESAPLAYSDTLVGLSIESLLVPINLPQYPILIPYFKLSPLTSNSEYCASSVCSN